ncbi:MAG: hypothetical protein J3K34DRAFT_56536 [Monoraphidium minutum]|nr:MAG: hypothetical protein J3K34DRAFT_56536 [Monoraphidium minutum]
MFTMSEWYYLDPSGQEHGPVAPQKIRAWVRKGHFDDNVQVRCRTPWMPAGMAAAVMGVGDGDGKGGADAAAAAARRSSSSSVPGSEPLSGASSGVAALRTLSVPPAQLEQPPPPPPRSTSMGGVMAAAAAALATGSPLAQQQQPPPPPMQQQQQQQQPPPPPPAIQEQPPPPPPPQQPQQPQQPQETLAAALFANGCEAGKEPLWRFIDAAGAIQVCWTASCAPRMLPAGGCRYMREAWGIGGDIGRPRPRPRA